MAGKGVVNRNILQLEPIWDFALEKYPERGPLFERLVAEIYASFWKGDFGLNGLVLWQDREAS
jgi:hypothetical protein